VSGVLRELTALCTV